MTKKNWIYPNDSSSSAPAVSPRRMAKPISNMRLKLSVVTSATTKSGYRIALQISQKIICPSTSRFFQVIHRLELTIVLRFSTDDSIVEEISEGCWPKRKRELDRRIPRKLWSQGPPAYSQNKGGTFLSKTSSARSGVEAILSE